MQFAVGIRRGIVKIHQAPPGISVSVAINHINKTTLQSCSQAQKLYPQDTVIAPLNPGSSTLAKTGPLQGPLSKSPVVELKSVEGAPIRECNRVGIRRGIVKINKRRLDFRQRADNHHQQNHHLHLCLKRRNFTLKIFDRSVNFRRLNARKQTTLPAVKVTRRRVEVRRRRLQYGMATSRNSFRGIVRSTSAAWISVKACIITINKNPHLQSVFSSRRNFYPQDTWIASSIQASQRSQTDACQPCQSHPS